RVNRPVGSASPTPTTTVLVAGGSDASGATDPRNSYESYTVADAGITSTGFLASDGPASNASNNLFPGPGTGTASTNLEFDWLQNYPRLHLGSDGRPFTSGYAHESSNLNLSTPGLWNIGIYPNQGIPGRPGSGTGLWGQNRTDGSTVFFAQIGAFHD